MIAIAEVKSGLDDFRTDRKWGEYMPYCDAFFFAVAPEFPRQIVDGADFFRGWIWNIRHRHGDFVPARRRR